MKRLGFYIADKTEHLQLDGYTDPNLSWARTAIVNGSNVINKTAKERNKLGLYFTNGKLKLNGSDVAAMPATDTGLGVISDNHKLKINLKPIFSTKECINITLEDYNRLRAGYEVEGYARYNSKQVYNIVEDVSSSEKVQYHNPYDTEDVIYNSIVGLPDNTFDDRDFTEPYNTPTLVVRQFVSKVKAGKGLTLEYFVDTREYDSVYKHQIGETFTVTIITADDDVIYKHTTYAGQFKITTSPLTKVGETWIKLTCVDSHGHRSIECFYDILVMPDENERIYNIGAGVLTAGENVTFEQAYKNKNKFNELCWYAKEKGYTGIRLHNNNPSINLNDLDNANNSVYLFDNRTNVATTEGEYIPAGNVYFLIHTVGGVIQGIDGYNPQDDSNFWFDKDDKNKLNLLTNYTIDEIIELFAPLKIEYQKEFDVDGVTRAVDEQDPYDWIRKDGAYIHRNVSTDADNGKILTKWYDVGDNEVSVRGAAFNNKPFLKVISFKGLLTDIVAGTPGKTLRRGTTNGDGYYYAALFTGRSNVYRVSGNQNTAIHTYGDLAPMLPNNFTIDLNGCTIKQTSNVDFDSTAILFRLIGNINTNIKNGKIVGVYSADSMKEAFLKQCKHGNAIWESAGPLVHLNGARHCTLDNVKISGSHGYELTLAPYNMATSLVTYSVPTKDLPFVDNYSLGFIDSNNQFNNSKYIIKGNNNESLVGILDTTYTYNGVSGKSAFYKVNSAIDPTADNDICIVTSDYMSVNTIAPSFGNITQELNDANESPVKVPYENPSYIVRGGYYYPTKNDYGGSYPCIFITFYNASNEIIGTVKTKHNWNFKLPKGTVNAKFSLYTVGRKVNNVFTVYQIPYIYNRANGQYVYHTRAMFLNLLKMASCNVAQGIVLNNCSITNTRSCAITDPGINVGFINCQFGAICSSDTAFQLTPMLVDVEEDMMNYSLLTFKNCVLTRRPTRPNYGNDQTVIGGFAKGYAIINCRGIGISGQWIDGYVADSVMGILRVDCRGGKQTNVHNIFKRVHAVQESEEYYSEGGRNTGENPIIETSKSCWEPVTKDMSFEDSFLVKQSNGTGVGDKDTDTEYERAEKALRRPYRVEIKGRTYKIAGIVTENYIKLDD